MASGEGETVRLHLYDISGGLATAISPAVLGQQVDGFWHTTVVLGGMEYSYGPVFRRNFAGQGPMGPPDRVVEVGLTHVPSPVRDDILAYLQTKYTPDAYSLLYNNCNHFANELCTLLTGLEIPSDLLNQTQIWMDSALGDSILQHSRPAEGPGQQSAGAAGAGTGAQEAGSSTATAAAAQGTHPRPDTGTLLDDLLASLATGASGPYARWAGSQVPQFLRDLLREAVDAHAAAADAPGGASGGGAAGAGTDNAPAAGGATAGAGPSAGAGTGGASGSGATASRGSGGRPGCGGRQGRDMAWGPSGCGVPCGMPGYSWAGCGWPGFMLMKMMMGQAGGCRGVARQQAPHCAQAAPAAAAAAAGVAAGAGAGGADAQAVQGGSGMGVAAGGAVGEAAAAAGAPSACSPGDAEMCDAKDGGR